MTGPASAWDEARSVETRANEILFPWLFAVFSRVVLVRGASPLAELVQREHGDVLVNDRRGDLCAIEIKAETENRYGRLFLETWSNEGKTPGWLFTKHATYLLYYFLASDELYVARFDRLVRWARTNGNLERFPERTQRKYHQKNVTVGRCVDIAVLQSAEVIRRVRPGPATWLTTHGGIASD